jgi:hypothetical protein
MSFGSEIAILSNPPIWIRTSGRVSDFDCFIEDPLVVRHIVLREIRRGNAQ